MIVAGSAWTSDQIDLNDISDGSDPDISTWEWEVTYFTRVGDMAAPVDDYGSVSGRTIPYLLRKSADSGVTVVDEATAVISLTLTAADTETIRANLGRDVWKQRLLTIQVRRTEGASPVHVLFLSEIFQPGGAA